MLKNYFLIAFRSIVKNKTFSAITVFGLTIGISVFISIILLVNYELAFNTQINDGGSIYRITTSFSGLFTSKNPGIPRPAGPFIKENLTGIESAAMIYTEEFSIGIPSQEGIEEKFFQSYDKILITEPSYFDIVSNYEWLAGDKKTALKEPYQVVITESRAKLYFGEKMPVDLAMGREIVFRDSLRVYVSGVVKDFTFNSDFTFTDFISMATIEKSWLEKIYDYHQWGNTSSSLQLFIKLQPDTKVEDFQKQMALVEKKHDEMDPNDGVLVQFLLQPLSDIHTNKEINIFDMSPMSIDKKVLNILIIIGFLILLIAIINFINLETAQSTQRAKEIGVRKVMGSSRKEIIIQFLMQSILLSTLAALLSLPFVQIAFVLFKDMIPEGIALQISDSNLWIFLALTTLCTGLLAGIYPAFVLSSFQPVQALKSKIYSQSGNNISVILRKFLTIFQFGFAQALITLTIVGISQLNLIRETPLGFYADNRIHIRLPWDAPSSDKERMIYELKKLPEISATTNYSRQPSYGGYNTTRMIYKNDTNEVITQVHSNYTDENYFNFFGLEIKEGRIYIPKDSSNEIMVNEAFMDYFGFQNIEDANKFPFEHGIVVGVVKNYHFQSLHHDIEPQVFMYEKVNNALAILAASNENDTNATIQKIEKIWQEIFPNDVFNSTSISESIERQYSDELKIAKLVYSATAIALIISCMGLFGLASFVVNQRTKEIGIRKVLGASSNQIVGLISSDFIKLVLLAFLLSLPVAYYLSMEWLNNFHIKINLSPTIFMVTLLSTLLISFVTLLFQIVKTTTDNPINSLRDE